MTDVDPGHCPLCGNANDCALAAGGGGTGRRECWCAHAVIAADLLTRVPSESRGRACVCQGCAGVATQRHAAVAGTATPGDAPTRGADLEP